MRWVRGFGLIAPLVALISCGGRSVSTSDRGGHEASGGMGERDGVISLSSHWRATCALFRLGSVRCWGNNEYGALGYGDKLSREAPGPALELGAPAVSIAVGGSNACAALEGGDVRCWGRNYDWMLGVDDDVDRSSPGPVVDLAAPAVKVTAGLEHSCALLEDGRVECWGNNSWGQLGAGDRVERPMQLVELGARAVDVGAGAYHNCALLEDGAVRCWGQNLDDQIGRANGPKRSVPDPPLELGSAVVALSVGGAHSCVLLEGGSLQCWGHNGRGALGDGTTTNQVVSDRLVELGAPAIAVAAGESFTCALMEDAAVRCWGENNVGQLGYGDKVNRSLPGPAVDVGGRTVALSAGSGPCALLENGSVRCWGFNIGSPDIGDATGDEPGEMPPPAVEF